MNIYLEILLWAVAIELVHYILSYCQNKKQKEYGIFFGKKVLFGCSFGKRARTIFGCSFGEQALTVVGFSFGKKVETYLGFSFGKKAVTYLGFSFGKEAATILGSSFGKEALTVFGLSFGKEALSYFGFSFGTKSATAPCGVSFSFGVIESDDMISLFGIGAINCSFFGIIIGPNK